MPKERWRLASAYRILGVSATSSKEEIRKQWKALSLSKHPDKSGEEGTEEMALINAAYDVLMNALDSPERSNLGPKSQQRRRSSLSTPNKRGKPPQPPPPTKASTRWPTRRLPTIPHSSDLSTPPPTFAFPTLSSLQHMHSSHLARLEDYLSLAKNIHDWLKDQPFTAHHPATYDAAGHVLSYLSTEIEMHRSLYQQVQALDWSKKKNKYSRKLVYWYIIAILDEHNKRAKLSGLHAWLERFVVDYMVAGQPVDESVEWEFVCKARRFCPES